MFMKWFHLDEVQDTVLNTLIDMLMFFIYNNYYYFIIYKFVPHKMPIISALVP